MAKKKAARVDARDEVVISLQESRKHLEEIGSRLVAGRLLGTAAERLALAAADDAVLAPLGFDATWRKAFEQEVVAARGLAVARSQVGGSGPELEAAVAAANRWIARYHVVVTNSGPRVRKAAPRVGHHEHSLKVLAAEVERLAAFVRREAKATERHGGGKAFSVEGEAVAAALVAARVAHKRAGAAGGGAIRELHAAEGVVYLELVRLSRAAHTALTPERAKGYALDAVRPHARGKHGAAAEGADGAASAGASEATGLSGPRTA